MSDTKFVPAEATHVSEFIREELEARGWSRQEVYERLGYDKIDCCAFDLLMDVHDRNLLMDKKLSEGLGDVFTVDADLFQRLHDAWRNHPTTVATAAASNIVSFKQH